MADAVTNGATQTSANMRLGDGVSIEPRSSSSSEISSSASLPNNNRNEPRKDNVTLPNSSTASPKDQVPAYSVYTRLQKGLLVGAAAWAASFSGLSSNSYFPAIPQIATDLGVSTELVNLSVTLYLVFQGISPSFWAPLSDQQGRRLVLLATFTVYFGACIGLALTEHYALLLVLRCLQSTGSACTIAVGAGIVGDIATRAERGGYMGIFSAGLLLSTAIGPVIGGVMSETVGWHAIFWFLTGYAGAFIVLVAIALPETLRRLVGNGSKPPIDAWRRCLAQSYWTPHVATSSVLKTEESFPARNSTKKQSSFRARDVFRPLLFLLRGDVTLCVLYLALHYTCWQMSITAMSSLFEDAYGLSELENGLTFLANGGGCILGSLAIGKLLDRDYGRVLAKSQAKNKAFHLARARLGTCWLFSLSQCAATIVFGWTIHYRVHIAVPIITTFITSAAATTIQTATNTFLIDLYPTESASVSATLNLARCLLGAAGTAVVQPMIKGVNVGWSMTILALLMAAANAMIILQIAQDPAAVGSENVQQ